MNTTTSHVYDLRRIDQTQGQRTRSRTLLVPQRRMSPARSQPPPRDQAARTGVAAPDSNSAPPSAGQRRVVVHPTCGPPDGIDVTESLIEAIAHELWKLHGGNDVLNWIEAEAMLHDALRRIDSR